MKEIKRLEFWIIFKRWFERDRSAIIEMILYYNYGIYISIIEMVNLVIVFILISIDK